MSNNLFIVKPNESWNPFQLISQVENLIFYLFFFKYLSPFFCSSRILGLNVETPNPSNCSVDFADYAKILVET